MNALVRLLKVLGWLALVFVVGVGGTLWYEHHERMERKKAELSYFTDLKWQWHDEYDGIQIAYSNKLERLRLRKVNMHEKYVVHAYMKETLTVRTKDGIVLKGIPVGTPEEDIKARLAKERESRGMTKAATAAEAEEVSSNEDRKKYVIVKFIVDCKPNTVIVTSLKFSSGNPKELSCNEEGDALIYGMVFGGEELDSVIQENLDGFKYRVDFRDWDFTKLDQEITLSKAEESVTEEEKYQEMSVADDIATVKQHIFRLKGMARKAAEAGDIESLRAIDNAITTAESLQDLEYKRKRLRYLQLKKRKAESSQRQLPAQEAPVAADKPQTLEDQLYKQEPIKTHSQEQAWKAKQLENETPSEEPSQKANTSTDE